MSANKTGQRDNSKFCLQMFGKHHTWTVNRGSSSQELYTIQQDDAGSAAGANIYLPGKAKFGVSTADYIVRVQDRGKDFQITTKSGQLLAEVRQIPDLDA